VGRQLTAARARVAEADRAEYLEVLATLESQLGGHRHLWLFEHRGRRGEFLEFREGPASPEHAGPGLGDPGEAALAARLEALAEYDATRDDRWDEVSLPEHRGG
jgi:hypothetical protein